ncbi:GNAT family N-acetyltransferase [Riemerella anatipestifer]|nr:GNAT family N-acetyltransferase [Riemerella anatipestifer]MDY3534227.1 GNAT family N-acetyltransferase [Riemerella anatipestifer]MDY3536270.1 GNAT family N-acetyltransferase [Riemerella anatipestifer]
MLKTIRFKNFKDFVNHNREFINDNPISNVFLIRNLEVALYTPEIIIDFFNIEEKNQRIIVLFLQQTCLIYGNLTSDLSIEQLSKELNFEKFRNYNFAGNRIIIHRLLEINEASYEETKHLSIYKCTNVNEISINDIKITNATIENLEDVKKIHQEFINEFYAGYDNKPEISVDDLRNDLKSNRFFIIQNENEIMSIASYSKNFDFPELNFIFTKEKYRRNSYAKFLTFYITKYLLKKNEFVMLYTKGNNLSAKKCFETVGYRIVYEYTMSFKKI